MAQPAWLSNTLVRGKCDTMCGNYSGLRNICCAMMESSGMLRYNYGVWRHNYGVLRHIAGAMREYSRTM